MIKELLLMVSMYLAGNDSQLAIGQGSIKKDGQKIQTLVELVKKNSAVDKKGVFISPSSGSLKDCPPSTPPRFYEKKITLKSGEGQVEYKVEYMDNNSAEIPKNAILREDFVEYLKGIPSEKGEVGSLLASKIYGKFKDRIVEKEALCPDGKVDPKDKLKIVYKRNQCQITYNDENLDGYDGYEIMPIASVPSPSEYDNCREESKKINHKGEYEKIVKKLTDALSIEPEVKPK